ncbi:ATP-binding protein [Amycolatopsis stemonae]
MSADQAETVGDRTTVLAYEVADDVTELARVRAWARRAVDDLTEPDRVDVIAVLDELTSNALRHGSPPRQVRLVRRPGRLRIEVDDTSPDAAAPRSPSSTGGRGLTLVGACSAAWGQERRSTGKTVWAEFEPRRLSGFRAPG